MMAPVLIFAQFMFAIFAIHQQPARPSYLTELESEVVREINNFW